MNEIERLRRRAEIREELRELEEPPDGGPAVVVWEYNGDSTRIAEYQSTEDLYRAFLDAAIHSTIVPTKGTYVWLQYSGVVAAFYNGQKVYEE